MQDPTFPGMIAEPPNPTVDRTTTTDRSALRLQLLQVMGQFGITQSRLAESASISPGTMSNVCSDIRCSWSTWEAIIVGLIKYHPNAVLSFWVGLGPELRKTVLDSTNNKAIRTFASEVNSLNEYDTQTIQNSIKFMLGQMNPAVAKEFLREIAPSPDPTPDLAPSVSGNNYSSCTLNHNTTLNIFPQGIDLGISELIKTTIELNGSGSAPKPEQQKKSQ